MVRYRNTLPPSSPLKRVIIWLCSGCSKVIQLTIYALMSQKTMNKTAEKLEPSEPQEYLVWIDLEMTGLNPGKDKILEIATIITNNNLDIIARGPELVISPKPLTVLDNMDAWCTKQHKESGLLERIAQAGVDVKFAEQETLKFLKNYLKPNASPICGNSVYQDRRFLYIEMPELESFFHYRQLDVSTIKILAQRWAPKIIAAAQKKNSAHRAMDDVIESIDELKYYRERFFRI